MYDWNDLRIFLAVAREGSTLGASRRLNINQTTVSRRIQTLEHGLGLALFDRDTRGYGLTPQGRALLARAEAVEVATIDLETEALRLARDLTGVIRVTSAESIMTHIVSPLITQYRRLHPEVRFENLSSEARLNLEKGEADVAFRAGGEMTGDTLVHQRLPDVCWTAYCSEDYIASNGAPTSMEELRDHSIVAYGAAPGMQKFSIWFMSFVSGDQIVATCNSIPNMSGVLRSGMGVGLLACLDGDETPGLVRCFPPPPEMDSPWWLVASHESYQQPRVRSFMAFAAERIRQERRGMRGGKDTP
jgi:DNA-binding transcriptional LysR family regulator